MASWLFPISPVAASRPRVSRHGAYFAGPYKKFREEMTEVVPFVLGDSFPLYEKEIHVALEFFVKQPKKTKLDAPKADIDNYIKSCFDCLNGKLWVDDAQIISVYATKRWAGRDEDGHFTVEVNDPI